MVSAPGSMNGHTSPLRPVVLLVEDEPFVRMATADALEDAGFEVIETANAHAAQEVLLRRADIRVLFTDVRMPGSMDGLELASLVRSRWPHISVVITSGHLDPDNGMLPQEAVFIAKPYGEQAPAKAIRALLD
jgi:two-component system, response regulator PdtaR